MRFNSLLTLVLVTFLLASSGCRSFQAKEAVAVNDAVIAKHKVLVSAYESFIEALDEKQPSAISATLNALRDAASNGLSEVETLASPSCYEDFLPEASAMFRFYKETADEEYAQIAEYCSLDSITYAGYDSLQVLLKEVVAVQQEADQKFLQAQQLFAKSCGFKLVRNVE